MTERLLRRLYTAARGRVREWHVSALVRVLNRKRPSAATIMPVVTRLRAAWGNSDWSADLGFLEEVVVRVLGTSGPFLECGAGLSTVILGALARRNGADVWTLEQDAQWSRTIRDRLIALHLENVHVVHAPLEISDGVAWYAFDDQAMPRAFPTVFCDGPSVRKSQWPEDVYRAWRSGLVAELRRRTISFDTIVLDDAEDPRCPALIDTWRLAGLHTDVIETRFGRHVVATRQPPGRAIRDVAP